MAKPAKNRSTSACSALERGCPIACEAFKGSTADPNTVATQITKLRERFGLSKVILVGDRGMITSARIDEEFRGVEGLGWISALRNDAIQKLAKKQALQPELFDEYGLAEISCEELYPGERLVVCRNPRLAKERTERREALLEATEQALQKVKATVGRARHPYRGKDRIARRIERDIAKYKMLKHFELNIGEDSLDWTRKEDSIQRESRLDGLYVVRAGRVGAEEMDSEGLVRSYKSLANVEKAFRNLKTVDLQVRPIFHNDEEMVRAHIFICMLGYYVDWHMREALAPMLFAEEDREAAAAKRKNIVAPAERSDTTLSKVSSKVDEEGRPVHSLRTLLGNLSSIVSSTFRPKLEGAPTFEKLTQPTADQARAFELLGVRSPG